MFTGYFKKKSSQIADTASSVSYKLR